MPTRGARARTRFERVIEEGHDFRNPFRGIKRGKTSRARTGTASTIAIRQPIDVVNRQRRCAGPTGEHRYATGEPHVDFREASKQSLDELVDFQPRSARHVGKPGLQCRVDGDRRLAHECPFGYSSRHHGEPA